MKIQRFKAEPIDIEIETTAPLLVWLGLVSTFWRFIAIKRIQLTLGDKPFGKPYWRLYYARVKMRRMEA